MTIILNILLVFVAWLIPHLITKSSASVLVIFVAWYSVLIIGLLWIWILEIDVATLFLTLALVITRAWVKTPDANVPFLGGSVQDNTENLVIQKCHYRCDYGNKLSLCIERIWVLLQVYMNIDVILLLDNFWMKLDCYMCVQTLEGMYNIGWPINEIHYALQHCSCCLHCQSLPLIIFKS